MREINRWTPLGSGRTSLKDEESIINESRPLFPEDLALRTKKLDLRIEAMFIAWEVARLASKELDPQEERALMLLVLSLMISHREGSTRLPLEEGSHLDRALDELQATSEERILVRKLLEKARKTCGKDRGLETGKPGLSEIFGTPDGYRPLIIDKDFLYMQKLHVLEGRVRKNLHDRITAAWPGQVKPGKRELDQSLEEALQEVLASPPVEPFGKVELDEEQVEAVRTVLSGKIAVISGIPGSGKTSIVASVLRVLARAGTPPLESIALAAPTGKAADKLRRSVAGHLSAITAPGDADRKLAETCPPALTLHRLLGYRPGQDRFLHHENNLLAEQFVIVDESSMIDLAMMDSLLRALSPEARVVFLGDADQLPSIEAGAVLRDLCRAEAANSYKRVAVLTQSYRAKKKDSSGKQILDTATTINRGEAPQIAGERKTLSSRTEVNQLNFSGVEHLQIEPGEDSKKIAFLSKWHNRLFELKPGLMELLSRRYIAGPVGFDREETSALDAIIAHYEKFRILCVTRVAAGGSGSEAVNEWFHHRFASALAGAGLIYEERPFLVGEPVLLTRNDYILGLYNGDSGLVLPVATSDGSKCRPAEPMAVFPRGGGFTAFPLGALQGKLDYAWATTVHKAQGSEYDNVAILLPEVYLRPLTRELLYTAITRAKKSVVIAGPGEVLEQGVSRVMERSTGLVEALK
ncbi:MAG: exodeoxyribonuclease V subunit alpha [Bacillota bacterium]